MADRDADIRVYRALLCMALAGLVAVAIGMIRVDSTRVLHAPPPPDFTLALSDDGRTLRFSGLVDFGLTKALRALAAANPGIARITLDSGGGYIAEARGAVTVLQAHGIATHVDGHCASACALIFAGGKTRSVAPDGRIGLHGYALRADREYFGMIDPRKEMARDMAIYRAQQIAEPFIAKIAALPQTPMWYPDHAQLRAAGFVTVP